MCMRMRNASKMRFVQNISHALSVTHTRTAQHRTVTAHEAYKHTEKRHTITQVTHTFQTFTHPLHSDHAHNAYVRSTIQRVRMHKHAPCHRGAGGDDLGRLLAVAFLPFPNESILLHSEWCPHQGLQTCLNCTESKRPVPSLSACSKNSWLWNC